MPTWPSPRSEQLGTPNPPRNPFHAGQVFRGFPIHAFATACQVARSPVRIRPTRSAPGSFYFQASNGSVALPVAGYDYNSDWTPLLAGLSPARMAASLAAPEPYVSLSTHTAPSIRPFAVAIASTPGLRYIRSNTVYALSFIRLQFEYGRDYHFVRQQTINRLRDVDLPQGVQPVISPAGTISEIFRYELKGPPGSVIHWASSWSV